MTTTPLPPHTCGIHGSLSCPTCSTSANLTAGTYVFIPIRDGVIPPVPMGTTAAQHTDRG